MTRRNCTLLIALLLMILLVGCNADSPAEPIPVSDSGEPAAETPTPAAKAPASSESLPTEIPPTDLPPTTEAAAAEKAPDETVASLEKQNWWRRERNLAGSDHDR